MKLLTFFIPLILYFLMGSANAYDCTFNTVPHTIDASTLVISPTANTGSMIGSVISSNEISYMTGCASTVGMYNSKFQFSAQSEESQIRQDGRYVYKMSDHKGLGIAIGASVSSCASLSDGGLEQWAGKGSGTNYFSLCSSTSGLANPTYKPKALIQFYKLDGLAPTTSTLRSVLIGEVYTTINSVVDRTKSKYVYLNIDIIQGSCAISTPNIAVNMGTIYKSEFSKSSSSMAAGPEVKFNIGVSCGASEVPVTLKIDGNNGNYQNTSMGIILNDTSIPNSAKAVGIQILRNGSPFQLAKYRPIRKLSGDNFFEFSAQYAKIPVAGDDNPVTVGKFKATATITLSYQ